MLVKILEMKIHIWLVRSNNIFLDYLMAITWNIIPNATSGKEIYV